MREEAGIDRTIGAVYAAAAEPSLWSDALARVGSLLGAKGAHLLYWDQVANRATFSVQSGFDEEVNRAYCEYYGAIDPKQPRYYALPVGEIFACHEYFDHSFVDRSEFFQDFLIPAGGRWCMVANLLRTPDLAAMIGVHRSTRMSRFEEPTVVLLRRLVPHLQRAAQLQHHLDEIAAQQQAMAAALDRLPLAIMLLDDRLRIVGANAAADDLLRAEDGLALRQGRLMALRPAADATLQRTVIGAARTARGLCGGSGGTLALPRPSGKRPLALLVAPLRPKTCGRVPELRSDNPLVILFIADSEQTVRPPIDLLRQLYNLTAREAELAMRLVIGCRLEDAAEDMEISRETARTHLKRIFSKTDTSRQAELVNLLLRSSGAGLLE